MFRLTELSDIDLDQLFNLPPNSYVLLGRELRLVGIIDAYPAVIGRSCEEALLGNVCDAFCEASPVTGRSFTSVCPAPWARRAP
ncbi:hypothetical protein J2046_003189 [Rhizobium petrolearium]|nr:hypothetical protein [Neorhizobium petrolearium]